MFQDGYASTWLTIWNKIMLQFTVTWNDSLKKARHSWGIQWLALIHGCTIISPKANAKACSGNTLAYHLPENSRLSHWWGNIFWLFSGTVNSLFWNITSSDDSECEYIQTRWTEKMWNIYLSVSKCAPFALHF